MEQLRALFRVQSGNSPSNAPSLAVGMSLGASSLDPFCKTSFDTLLDSAIDAVDGENNSLAFPEGQINNGQQNVMSTFPGFADTTLQPQGQQQKYLSQMGQLATLLQQEASGGQTSGSGIMPQTQSLPFPSDLAVGYERNSGSTSGMENSLNLLAESRKISAFSGISAGTLGIPVLNSNGTGSFFQISNSSPAPSPHSSPPNSGSYAFRNLRISSDHGGSEPSSIHASSSFLSGSEFGVPMPRATLRSLGVIMKTSAERDGGFLSGDPPMGSDRRREKNRVAQRRFRERQRSTVASLQIELDEKENENESLMMQMRVLEQTNAALTTKLLEYERRFGILPKPEE